VRRFALFFAVLAVSPARADAEVWRGPFRSSRLFAMPVADVVGAYQMTISGDGSLLQETGILSFAGVLAIGFGDIAQLEYRHTAAISVERTTAPVPAIGVQLEVPLPERRWWPAFAVAFRLGVPRREELGGTSIDETVTDLYLVSRIRLEDTPVTLHGGARVSIARIELSGDREASAERKLVLPAVGIEIETSPTARLVAELALAPRFELDASGAPLVEHGVLGRLGIRWAIVPALTFDGSLGYQLEVAGATPPEGASSVVQWDIRLGGELFVPWGALVCRAVGIFCE
jgi:hypothetical protein